MRPDPATVLVIIFGGVAFFFLILPLGVVLAKLPSLLRADPLMGAVVTGVVFITGLFFAVFLIAAGYVGFYSGG